LLALAAALLANRGLGRPSATIRLAISIAYGVVFLDIALLFENAGYAGRILVVAPAMVVVKSLGLPSKAGRFLC